VSVREKFERLFADRMDENEAREFLVKLYEKGESVEDVTAAVEVMRSHSVKLPLSEELRRRSIDIVGTGGDNSGSFNISTTVSLLLASMGCVIAKHGNRSITSRSGAADLLEALGYNLELGVEEQVTMLEETGFAFIFAMKHHPAMKHIMPVRRSIPHRTVFNLIGPLANPAGASKYLIGVFSPDFIEIMARVLVALGTKRAFVVSSEDGMDEISISAKTQFAYVEGERIERGIIDPREHGFNMAPKEEIIGGEAERNAAITRSIFAAEASAAQRDIVLLNASYALLADGKARDMQEAMEMCRGALDSGMAQRHLKKIIDMSNKLRTGRS
jgi:anthranilate phosphoribosyltransferase